MVDETSEGHPAALAPDITVEWLSAAVRNAHVAMGLTLLADDVFVDVNDAYCRLFQRTREQIVGRTSLELGFWPEEGQRERLRTLIRGQGSISGYEANYRNQRGETGRVQISATVVQNAAGAFVLSLLTEVSGEHELLQALQAAQSRQRVALQASGLLVFRQDQDLRYTWVANPALGATESDLIGRTDEEIMGPEAAQPLLAIKRRVLQTGQAERRDVWVANGAQLGCFDLVVEPELDAAGRTVAIVCAAQDITRRKLDSERAPREMSHWLHTLQGMASLIAREKLSEWQYSRLQRITHEAGRLSRQFGPDPAGPDTAPAPPAASWARQALRQHHGGSLVLVAEGNAVLRELASALLEDAGLRVTPASTGVEAFSLSLQLAPALLLLDMELPQRGSVAAARAVRAMVARRLPIIAMVSVDPPGGVPVELDADLDDVIDKPVVADRLYEKVLAWLQA